MRRRTLALAAPVSLGALLGMVACTSDGSSPESSSDPGSSPAASDGSAAPEPPSSPIDPTPTVEGTQAETVIGTELRLPMEMTVMIVVKPGWTAPVLQLDGMFLGFDEESDALRFVAMDQDGTIAWTARRPLSCTGFALSRTDGDRAIAVLADVVAAEGSGAKDQVAATSVTAYDLATAQQLWGPTEVPGPQVAPGLVFAAAGDQPMGNGGERVALSSSTGEVAISEADLEGGRIIAEHLGTILHTEGETLVAVSGADGARLWDLELPAGTDPLSVHVSGEISADTSFAVIRGVGRSAGTDSGTGADSGAGASDGGGGGNDEGAEAISGLLVDLNDGTVLKDGVSAAAHDLATDITVVLSGTVVTGWDSTWTEQWRHVDPEALQLVSAGERLSYAVRPQEGSLVVLDTLRGLMVQPYDADVTGTLGMPELFNAEAATVVRFEEDRYLVTTTLDEQYGMRE